MDHGGHSILVRGLYYFQLIPYINQCPKEHLLILSMKDIQGEKSTVLPRINEILSFLNPPPIDDLDISPKNTRSYDKIDEESRNLLTEFYRPYNEKLFQLLGYEINW
jgi:hypothetical protein